jgi:hypothetical protein
MKRPTDPKTVANKEVSKAVVLQTCGSTLPRDTPELSWIQWMFFQWINGYKTMKQVGCGGHVSQSYLHWFTSTPRSANLEVCNALHEDGHSAVL